MCHIANYILVFMKIDEEKELNLIMKLNRKYQYPSLPYRNLLSSIWVDHFNFCAYGGLTDCAEYVSLYDSVE